MTTVAVNPALINTPGWHVRDVDADRNPLCQSDPRECGIDGRKELWTILVVLVRDASRDA
jgi:hypothetical protein